MVETWTVWVSISGASITAAALGAYFALRAQSHLIKNRLMLLEREVALGRVREEYNERKLQEILETILTVHRSAEDQLRRLREKVDELMAVMDAPEGSRTHGDTFTRTFAPG